MLFNKIKNSLLNSEKTCANIYNKFSIVKRRKRLWTLEPDRNVVSPTESTTWGMRTIGNTLEQTS